MTDTVFRIVWTFLNKGKNPKILYKDFRWKEDLTAKMLLKDLKFKGALVKGYSVPFSDSDFTKGHRGIYDGREWKDIPDDLNLYSSEEEELFQ